MGGKFSVQNTIDTAVEQSISVLNKAVQDCTPVTGCEQNTTINSSCPGDVTVEDLNFNCNASTFTQCNQDAVFDTKADQNVSQVMQQLATVITQALQLSLTDTEVDNKISSVVSMSIDIKNIFRQNCSPSTIAAQNLTISKACPLGGSGNVIVRNIDFNAVLKAQVTCLMKSASSTAGYQSLVQNIGQKGSAVQEAIPLIFIAIIVLGFFAMLTFGGKTVVTRLTDWKFVLTAGIVVAGGGGGYLFLASKQKWWPFNPKKEDDKNTNSNSQARLMQTGFNRALMPHMKAIGNLHRK